MTRTGKAVQLWILSVLRFCQIGNVISLLNKVLALLGWQLVPNILIDTLKLFMYVNKHWVGSLFYFDRLFALIADVKGDIVECGVGDGGTLLRLSVLVVNRQPGRHIWGFDSFEGLPKPSKNDLTSPKSLAKLGLYAASPEKFIARLKASGLDDNEIKQQVTIVKGWFSDSLPKYSGPSIALLHIDADLYDSYKCCLENLWPRVAIGGIVAFDEYEATETWPGARKAVDEYFSDKRGTTMMYRDPQFGKYYIVKLS